MTAIKIFEGLYIIDQKVNRNLGDLEYFDMFHFLSMQKPKTFSKISYSSGNKVMYRPALGNYLFSSKPDFNPSYELEKKAFARAKETSKLLKELWSCIIFGSLEAKRILGTKQVVDDEFRRYM